MTTTRSMEINIALSPRPARDPERSRKTQEGGEGGEAEEGGRSSGDEQEGEGGERSM
jgi:hypothetical protein